MKFSLTKYNYFQYKDANGKNTIAAMSTYAGKRVKGYAKCDPRDTMNVERGKALAAARCNEKIANKRANRACKKLDEARDQLQAAKRHYQKMKDYFEDSVNELHDARENVKNTLDKM